MTFTSRHLALKCGIFSKFKILFEIVSWFLAVNLSQFDNMGLCNIF